MEVQAVAKYIKVQPRKVRIVAALVRGKSARQSAEHLRFHPSKGAFVLRKVIMSAIANAQENHGLAPDSLTIAAIKVDEGPIAKRIQARAMGRANRILKKTSHITVVVADAAVAAPSKGGGTKAKPRPKFEAPKAKRQAGKAKAAAEEAVTEEPVAEEPVAEEPAVEPIEAEATATEEATEETTTQEETAEEAQHEDSSQEDAPAEVPENKEAE